MVKVPGLVHVQDPEMNVIERAPYFEVEVAVSIQPSGTHQIDPAEVRSWLMELKTEHGFTIGGVSYDGFDSHESIQRWIKAGVRNTRVVGLDRTPEGYFHLRRVLYQDRIDSVDSEVLRHELLELEYNEEKDKVDHPPRGSKDVADAVAGAVLHASNSRKVRSQAAYVDEDGERVRAGPSRKARRSRPKGRRTSRVRLRERNRILRETGKDPWEE